MRLDNPFLVAWEAHNMNCTATAGGRRGASRARRAAGVNGSWQQTTDSCHGSHAAFRAAAAALALALAAWARASDVTTISQEPASHVDDDASP